MLHPTSLQAQLKQGTWRGSLSCCPPPTLQWDMAVDATPGTLGYRYLITALSPKPCNLHGPKEQVGECGCSPQP